MWHNALIRWLLRSPFHRFLSGSFTVIVYTGRKSGRTYKVPVNYLRLANGELLTTSFRRRVWWRNLRGGAPVRLWLGGREVPAEGEVVEDSDQVAEGYREYFQAAPGQARFFNVSLDGQGQPDPEDLAALARERVMVRVRLASG
jgi:hypothetical protein